MLLIPLEKVSEKRLYLKLYCSIFKPYLTLFVYFIFHKDRLKLTHGKLTKTITDTT